MIEIGLDRRWRVSLKIDVETPMPATEAWRQLTDLRRFACVDIFHRRLIWAARENKVGGTFFLEHKFLFWSVMRNGRVLTWREGSSYSFSDLSERDPQLGFPHVYCFRVEPLAGGCSRVTLQITGRWTAQWIPRPLVRIWFRWILLHTREKLANLLLKSAIEAREGPGRTSPGHLQRSLRRVPRRSPASKGPSEPTRRFSWG